MSTNKEPCGVTCFLALFFFSFFFARQHSEHHLPLICTAVIMIVRYDTMRRVLCVFLFVFFCFGLSCQPRMQPCCSLSLPPAPLPWLVQAPCTLRRHNMKDTWTWLLVATFSRVNIPLLCLPKFFGVVVVTPLARLLKTCCLFL